ncbi:MFS transporter, partial [Acinetobacter pittii]|uniref:MFS transporter n=1 Tax=Acinetobacter pittii TaxID=48296 RepID=UPI0011231A1A
MLKKYFLIILINASRNSLLVLIAWEAIKITNVAGSVGLNLAFSNIFFLLASSLSGLIVDKFGSNRVLIFSEFLWCSVLLLFVVLRFFQYCDSFIWLNIFSCILAIFTGMSATATYSLLILTAKNNNDSIN